MQNLLEERLKKAIFAWIAHYQRPFTEQEIESLAALIAREVEGFNVDSVHAMANFVEEAKTRINTDFNEILDDIKTLDPQSIQRRFKNDPGIN